MSAAHTVSKPSPSRSPRSSEFGAKTRSTARLASARSSARITPAFASSQAIAD